MPTTATAALLVALTAVALCGCGGAKVRYEDHLERGKKFDLSDTLKNGGVLVFPHTGIKDCGYQVAACVHACLDSGADQVLVISVLHAFTDDMEQARRRVAAAGTLGRPGPTC